MNAPKFADRRTKAFLAWMDKKRPWWRNWKRNERAACNQAQIADMMAEAWNAARRQP